MKLYETVTNADGSVDIDLARMYAQQRACMGSDARFTFFLAGTQSGKTAMGPWWLYNKIDQLGPGDYLAVSSTFPLLRQKMMRELREVFERVLGVGRFWSSSRVIEICDPATMQFWAKRQDDPMWGRIILGSAERGGSLESATANAAWIDECGQDEFGLDAYEAVLRRLSLMQGPLLGTTTLYNLGWIMVEVYERWLQGDPDYLVVHADSVDNPAFPREEFERAKRTMPAWKFEMQYRGRPDRPPGMIYNAFQNEIGGHVVKGFPIPAAWPRFVGVDFGAVNTALVWLAYNPQRDVYYAYRESLEGGKTTAEHAAEALALAEAENVTLWAGGAKSETQQRMDWGSCGVWMREPVVTNVEAGIDRVIALLKQRRLYVFESLRGLRSEFGTYSRVLDNRGQATEKIADKQTYHRLDALRYVVQQLDVPQLEIGGMYDD